MGGKAYGEGALRPRSSPPPSTPVVADACIPGYPGLLTPSLTLPPRAPRLCLLSQMLKVSAVLCVCAAAWCSQALAAAAAVAAAGGRSDGGNFLDDKQWLTTISQYDKEVGQWNKFRDVSAAHPRPRAQERATPRRGPRRLGMGGQWARFSEARALGRRGGAQGLQKLAVPMPPSWLVQGDGELAGALEFGSHQVPARLLPLRSPTVSPHLPRPPKVCKVLAQPSQLLNGVSGNSKHGRCAFAVQCLLLK